MTVTTATPQTSAPSIVRYVHEYQISVPTTMLLSLMAGVGCWGSGAPYFKEAGAAIAGLSIALGCAHQCFHLVADVAQHSQHASVRTAAHRVLQV